MRRPTERIERNVEGGCRGHAHAHAHGHDVPLHRRRHPHPRAGLHRRRLRHPLRVAPRRVPGLGLDLGLTLDRALAAPGVVKGSGVSGDG